MIKPINSSILSIFKVGIGPSSSHTVGPMLMGLDFTDRLDKMDISQVKRIKVDLYGSLSFTGKGHMTDKAIMLGLSGLAPNNTTTTEIHKTLDAINNSSTIILKGQHTIDFVEDRDFMFHQSFLTHHSNGLIITAYDKHNVEILKEIYYSVGGGFIATEKDLTDANALKEHARKPVMSHSAYHFTLAKELGEICRKHNISIAEAVIRLENENYTTEEIKAYCDKIWHTMHNSVINGLSCTEEFLPGSIRLKRRAPKLHAQFKNKKIGEGDFSDALAEISAYAIAVSEENASGNIVVTAPTNGACGIVPAVITYYNNHIKKLNAKEIMDFLLTASAIGHLYKVNASISGADAGCQAEIGSASSMAAAAIASLKGATVEQALIASEIAMEHHLGLTCDPVAGLVQVPCIERNAFGATKAFLAADMAMQYAQEPLVDLDEMIAIMYETGKDMHVKYKETSQGKLGSLFANKNVAPPCE